MSIGAIDPTRLAIDVMHAQRERDEAVRRLNNAERERKAAAAELAAADETLRRMRAAAAPVFGLREVPR